jgi:hypothetical protein
MEDASYVVVTRWIGSSTYPRSKAYRDADDVLHVQSVDDGYTRTIPAGEWVTASTGPGDQRKYLQATTPTRQPARKG